jgi:hypothetical protein
MGKNRGSASRGMILGVSTTAIITVLAHILQLAQGVDMIRDQDKSPEPPLLKPLEDGYTRIIITDTVLHTTDTMRLVDYAALKKEGKVDTVNKRRKLFYPGVTY